MKVILFALFVSLSLTCTQILIEAQDGSRVIGRTMEYGLPLHTQLVVQPRGHHFDMLSPPLHPGYQYTNKYGYIYLDTLLQKTIPTDGLNEKGLALGALYFPGFAGFQNVSESQRPMAIAASRLGLWMLGNFATVDEIREELPKYYVWSENPLAILHWGVYDASGKGIVIEYVKGVLSIFDNDVYTFTNSPTFDWHLNNIRRYQYLSTLTPQANFNGKPVTPFGVGYGMIGLPGDWSPPSRFVRAFVQRELVHNNSRPANVAQALNVAQHILNTVDIVKGITWDEGQFEYTQYSLFIDITNLAFHWKTYDDFTLKTVTLSSVNIKENAPVCHTKGLGSTALICKKEAEHRADL